MGRAFKIGTGLESHVGGEILEAFNVFNLVADVPFLNSQTDPFLNASILVLTALVPVNIYSLGGITNNRNLIVLVASSSSTITLKNNNAEGTAGSRFLLGADDVTLNPNQSLNLLGNTIAGGWVPVGSAAIVGGGAPQSASYVTVTDETANLPNSFIYETNVEPALHTIVPANPANDEFEIGNAIDTSGSRFVGAIPWTIYNPQNTTNLVNAGALQWGGYTGAVNNNTLYGQPITNPALEYNYVSKRLPSLANAFTGIAIVLEASGKGYYFGTYEAALYVISQNDFIGTGATQQYNVSITSAYFPVWLQILYDGTDLNFAYSFDGTQYNTIFSATPASFIGSNPDTCGLHFGNLVSLPDFTNQGATDYFRRTF